MRKLQTDEQWAAVVILPSELIIFYFGSIFFESTSLHASKKKSGSPCCMYITDKQTNNDGTRRLPKMLSYQAAQHYGY